MTDNFFKPIYHALKRLLVFIIILLSYSSIKGQVVQLNSPLNNIVISDTNVSFSWNELFGMSSYDLQVSSDVGFISVVASASSISANNYRVSGLPSNKDYYWRIRGYNGASYTGFSSIRKFTIFNPKNLLNLLLWLKADSSIVKDGSNFVNGWSDLSGNNNHFSQVISNKQPLWLDKGIANLPSLGFDGTSLQELESATLLNPSNFTNQEVSMFFIWSLNGTVNQYGVVSSLPGGNGYWRYGGDGTGYLQSFRSSRLSGYPNAVPSSGTHISSLVVSHPSNKYQLYNDGVGYGNQGSDWGIGASFLIGRDEISSRFNGLFSEIIICNSALNDSLRLVVEKYLANKYAPPVNLGPDKNDFFCKSIDAGDKYTSYLWSTGESTSKITIDSSGTYWVKVTDVFGNISSDTIDVIFPAINQINNNNICLGDSLIWNTNLKKSNYSFQWQDNSTDSLIKITTKGKYYVKVTDSKGCFKISDTLTLSIDSFAVIATLGPDVALCTGNKIGLVKGSGSAKSYLWNDNSIDSILIINPPGQYFVKVTNNNNCIKHDTINVSLKGTAPIANFSISSTCLGDSTHFKDLSQAVGGGITSWNWTFGDSTVSTIPSPSRLFKIARKYDISLSIESANGCNNTLQKSFTVNPNPVASFVTPDVCLGASTIVNSSTIPFGNIVKSMWNFGDTGSGTADTVTATNGTHEFSYPGIFQVTLSVVSDSSCASSITKAVTSFATFSPKCISNLVLWLKADSGVVKDGSNFVNGWSDLSGNNNNFSQVISNKQPLWLDKGIANLPSLGFDGSSLQELENTTLLSSSNFTNQEVSMFFIWSLNGTVNQYGIVSTSPGNGYWRYGGDGMGYLQSFRSTRLNGYPNSVPVGGAHISSLVASQSSNKYQLYNDGVGYGNQTSDWGIGANFLIGRDESSGRFHGSFSEIIIYNSALSDSLRLVLEKYLANKYAPPVSLGPDRSESYCKPIDAGDKYTSYLWSTGESTSKITADSSGTYWVKVTDIFGKISSDTINVTFPIINQISKNTICMDDSLIWNTYLNKNKYTFQWQDNSADSLIKITTQGKYYVKVTDSKGCFKMSDTLTVRIDSFAVAATLGPDVALCTGNKIGLVKGSDSAKSYLWNNNSADSDSILIINPPGQYFVKVVNSNNCIKQDTINVSLKGTAPIANFSVSSTCLGDSTKFTDLSVPKGNPESPIEKWLWDFGDATTSSDTNSTHLYADDKNYIVNLTIYALNGCSNTLQKTITVNPNPTPLFVIPDGCSNTTIDFINTSTIAKGAINKWLWNFGDTGSGTADTSSEQNSKHNFINGGTYQIKLSATSDSGCVNTDTRAVTIKETPAANFSYPITCEDSYIVFNDITNTSFPSSSIASWNWNFGDGSPSSINEDPSHLYLGAGTFNVSLTVKATNNCSSSITKTISINAKPKVSFTTGNVCSGALTQFSNASSIMNSSIASWKWIFGSIGTDTSKNPSFVFPDTGFYAVKLIATSIAGCKDSVNNKIRVNMLPKTLFSFDPTFGSAPLTVNFTDKSIGATGYAWDFGDGSAPGTVKNPTHTFADNDTFKICLTTNNIFGCKNELCKEIRVIPPQLDIAIEDINAIQAGNKLSISTNISNLGTRDIYYFEVFADVGNGTIIQEIFNDTLFAGETRSYNFKSSLQTNPNKSPAFLCVTVKNPNNEEEEILSNNKQCKTLTDAFYVLDLFPNPSSGSIFIQYILPFNDFVSIVLFDDKGSITREIFSGEGQKGLNEIIFDTRDIHVGTYSCKIVYRDKVVVKKMIKL